MQVKLSGKWTLSPLLSQNMILFGSKLFFVVLFAFHFTKLLCKNNKKAGLQAHSKIKTFSIFAAQNRSKKIIRLSILIALATFSISANAQEKKEKEKPAAEKSATVQSNGNAEAMRRNLNYPSAVNPANNNN